MRRNNEDKALEIFNQTLSYLEFHLGKDHPLYSTVYFILGSYYVEKGNYTEALNFYKLSLNNCCNILGTSHPYTGEVYQDLGNLTLKMQLKDEALGYFEKAYEVFRAHKGEDSFDCATISLQMASLLIVAGRVKDAKEHTLRALKFFEKDEEKYINTILECSILMCQIAEIVKKDILVIYSF